jgi:hypothetical protein
MQELNERNGPGADLACTCRSSSLHARLRRSHGYLQVQADSNTLAEAITVCLTAPQHLEWRCIRWTAIPIQHAVGDHLHLKGRHVPSWLAAAKDG